MPRPTTKESLLSLSEAHFRTLMAGVLALPEETRDREFPPGTLNRNIRDVLAHLHHWHLLMAGWYESGMRGEVPVIPAPGYTWKDTPALNRWIWGLYQTVDTAEVIRLLNESHQRMRALIEEHSDEELFEKKRYKWTGTTSLGAYFVSATSSHYDWAIKLLKRVRKG